MSNLDGATLTRIVVGEFLALAGGWIVLFNWATIPWNARNRARGVRHHVSSVPLVGPLLLSLGVGIVFRYSGVHLLWCWIVDWPTACLPIALARARSSVPPWRRRPGVGRLP